MKMHELKTIDPFFEQLGPDKKNLEIRYNDRKIERGDILILAHWLGSAAEWSGKAVLAKVIYRLPLITVPNLVIPNPLGMVTEARYWEAFGLKFYEDGKQMKRTEAHKYAHKLVS